MKSLSVLIPAYNEERLIERTTLSFLDYLKSLKIDFEIIVCINQSTDKTEEILISLSKKHNRIKYLSIREKGFGVAIQEGIKAAKKDFICYMPADDELGKDFIERALKEIEDYDVILGSRYLKRKYLLENIFRESLSRVFAKIIRLFFSSKITEFGTIKMFRTEWAKKAVKKCTSLNFEFQVEMLYLALRERKGIKEIPVKITYQTERKSKVNVIRDSISLSKSAIKYGVKLRIHQLFRQISSKLLSIL